MLRIASFIGLFAAIALLAGGCQSYGSRPYDVKLDSAANKARLFLIPNSEWVKKSESLVYQPGPARDSWLTDFELKQANRPIETKLLGYQHVFVVIDGSGNVYVKPFNPMNPDERVIDMPPRATPTAAARPAPHPAPAPAPAPIR
jgi:hypothetical protein